jgi:hypothetical protein
MSLRRFPIVLTSTLFVILQVSIGTGAIRIEGFSTDRHDRFRDDPAPDDFILSQQDLTGVARSTDGRWATMISPTHFLSADHFPPGIGSTLTFHHDNSTTGVTLTRTVTTGMQLGGTDLWIGQLNAPVDQGVKIYSIADPGVYLDVTTVYHIGLSMSGPLGSDTTTDFAVGRNVYDLDLGLVTISSGQTTYAAGYLDDSVAGDLASPFTTGPNNLSPDETYFNSGDSGGPTFIDSNGDLLLFGIHSFQADISLEPPHNSSSVERRASGDSYLPEYKGDILMAIPEPSAFMAVLVGVVLSMGALAARRFVAGRR